MKLLLVLMGGVIGASALLLAVAGLHSASPAGAAPGDLSMIALSCDTSPEFVRIENFGSETQSLSGFRLQSSTPSGQGEDYDLSAYVASISAGQTLEFQSGAGAADDPSAGIYKLTDMEIYRDGDPTDYARLVYPDLTPQMAFCRSAPGTTEIWPDADCNGSLTIGDAQKIARSQIGLSVSQTEPCPDIGDQVQVSSTARPWADGDCNGSVTIGDAQKIARFQIGLSVSQTQPCPAFGSEVQITT